MKRALQIAASVILVSGIVTWAVLGHSLGWTKTSRPVMQVDPVTNIEYPSYRQGFFPGIDFLGAVILAGLSLYGGSMAVRSGRKIHNS